MAKPPQELSPWSVRPKRAEGDAAPDALYATVGRALSAWGNFETHLAVLFGVFMSSGAGLEMAARAFGSVRTFEGRLSMLEAAGEAFFSKNGTTDIQVPFESLCKGAWRHFGSRRNEITHGVVQLYGPALDRTGAQVGRWYLVPAFIDFQKWKLRKPPAYCYVAADIEHYVAEFGSLSGPVSAMMTKLAEHKLK